MDWQKRLRMNDSGRNAKDFVSCQVPTTSLSQIFLFALTCVYGETPLLRYNSEWSCRCAAPIHYVNANKNEAGTVLFNWRSCDWNHQAFTAVWLRSLPSFRNVTAHQWVMIAGVPKEDAYTFQVRHPRCVEYKLKYNIKIYNTIIHNLIFY